MQAAGSTQRLPEAASAGVMMAESRWWLPASKLCQRPRVSSG